MTFLAINSQRSLFAMQKSQLEFERTIIVSRVSALTQEMQYLAESGGDDNYMETSQYQALEATEMYYQTRPDSIDNELAYIEASLNSLKTLANNNIKNSGTLNLSGS